VASILVRDGRQCTQEVNCTMFEKWKMLWKAVQGKKGVVRCH
jgi:hypothetical protein